MDPTPDRPREPGCWPERVDGWRAVRVVRSTASTNEDLLDLAAGGEPAGLVLVAHEQTAGRGRLGRAWTAPPGSALTFSVLLRPARPVGRHGWLPLLTGLGVVEALRPLTGLDLGLKWPNDVLAGGRKLGGILAERAGDAVVVGIGLNVSQTEAELAVPTATSLLLAGSTTADLGQVLVAVLHGLARRLAAWDVTPAETPAADAELRAAYRAACTTVGRHVRAELPGGRTLRGVAEDLDEEGRLLVRVGAALAPVGAGDVVHLH